MNFQNLKMTALINAFSVFKIPALAFITPRVLEMSDTRNVVKVRLDLRTRNHLGVMYFGALAMGAELSIALRAIKAIQDSGTKIDFIFKDFQADFLKRADGHVHFVCDEGAAVAALVAQAVDSADRFVVGTSTGFLPTNPELCANTLVTNHQGPEPANANETRFSCGCSCSWARS